MLDEALLNFVETLPSSSPPALVEVPFGGSRTKV